MLFIDLRFIHPTHLEVDPAIVSPVAKLIMRPIIHKEAGREIRNLETFLGRVNRNTHRGAEDCVELKSIFPSELASAGRLLTLERQDKNK